MRAILRRHIFFACGLLLLAALPLGILGNVSCRAEFAGGAEFAENAAAENSSAAIGEQPQTPWWLAFVQKKLSTPNRQITVAGISGTLSSVTAVRLIAVADREGVWLKIHDAVLDWNRLQLLRGRISVNTVTAKRVELLRLPLPDGDAAEAAAQSEAENAEFSLPHLPVDIDIAKLDIDKLSLGQEIFGQASDIALKGDLHFASGLLNSALQGTVFPAAMAGDESDAQASGKILNLTVTMQNSAENAAAAGERVQFNCRAGGAFAQLLPPAYRAPWGDNADFTVEGALMQGYGIRIDKAAVKAASVNVTAEAATAADGFLRRLYVLGSVGNGRQGIVLPLQGKTAKLQSADINIDYGNAVDGKWSAVARMKGAAWEDTHGMAVQGDALNIALSGIAENLDNVAGRHIAGAGSGAADRLIIKRNGSESAAYAIPQLIAALQADWRSGKVLQLQKLSLKTPDAHMAAQGEFTAQQFAGDVSLTSANIANLAALFGQSAHGAVDARAHIVLGLDTGDFAIDINGGAKGVTVGDTALNSLLQGDSRISGGLLRTKNGLEARNLRIAGTQMQLFANGSLNRTAADLDFNATIADVKALLPLLRSMAGENTVALATHNTSGALAVRGAARGHNGIITVSARGTIAEGVWFGQTLQNITLNMNGITDMRDSADFTAADAQAQISGSGHIGGDALQLQAVLRRKQGLSAVENLDFTLGDTVLQGFLRQQKNGNGKQAAQQAESLLQSLWAGKLRFKAESIAPLAALALMQGEGKADVELDLQANSAASPPSHSAQDIAFKFSADNLALRRGFDTAKSNVPLLQVRQAAGQGHMQAENLQLRTLPPNLDFDMQAQGARSSILADMGIAVPLSLRAKGKMEQNAVVLDAALLNDELRGTAAGDDKAAVAENTAGAELVHISGQADLAGKTLDLQAKTTALPLAMLQNIMRNSFLAQQNLHGILSAQAHITGDFANPHIAFSGRGEQISALVLTAAKIAPLNIQAEGALDNGVLHLQNLQLQGQSRTQLSVAGDMPIQPSAEGARLRVQGSLPLAAINPLLEQQGSQCSGTAVIDGMIEGSLLAPKMQGNFAVEQGQFIDAQVNLRLQPININGHFQGDELVFDKAVLHSYSGGDLVVSGKASLNAALGFPLQLQLGFDKFRYNDGSVLDMTASGALQIGGAVMQGATIGGKIQIDKAEIRIPESFGGAGMIAVENKNMPEKIAQTQKRAGIDARKNKPVSAAEQERRARILPRMDIEINAPKQFFVRGHGLDAEMGGQLHISGRIDDLHPVGGFNLIRGKFDILSQRLIFKQGQVGLAGSLDPDLNFVAVSEGVDVTVTVTVSGTPKDLKIVLSSDPVLPQDEVLARLIFRRSMSELSPFQIAQLVDAAAELTGATSHSVFGGLRRGTGIDVTSDQEGNAGVSLGRYLMNKLYFGVETSVGGASKGTVNMDITKHLKAKGSMGSDSNSTMGVFYEKDY